MSIGSRKRKAVSGRQRTRTFAYGLRLTAYGLRLTAYGLRLTAYGLRLSAFPIQDFHDTGDLFDAVDGARVGIDLKMRNAGAGIGAELFGHFLGCAGK